jgi:hypothetical protein
MILGVTSSKGNGLHVTEMATQIFILQKNNIRWFFFFWNDSRRAAVSLH